MVATPTNWRMPSVLEQPRVAIVSQLMFCDCDEHPVRRSWKELNVLGVLSGKHLESTRLKPLSVFNSAVKLIFTVLEYYFTRSSTWIMHCTIHFLPSNHKGRPPSLVCFWHVLKLETMYIYKHTWYINSPFCMFCWPCISIDPCNENQLHTLSVGRATDSQLKSTTRTNFVYIQYTSWWGAKNMPETCSGWLTK